MWRPKEAMARRRPYVARLRALHINGNIGQVDTGGCAKCRHRHLPSPDLGRKFASRATTTIGQSTSTLPEPLEAESAHWGAEAAGLPGLSAPCWTHGGAQQAARDRTVGGEANNDGRLAWEKPVP